MEEVGVKPRSPVRVPVLVVADWDADGATAAAMIYYAQWYKGLYPLHGRHDVFVTPSGPRGLPETITSIIGEHGCPQALVVLDIPLTEKVYTLLLELARKCKATRIIYVDHHYSTIYGARKLYQLSEEVYIGHKPTAILTFNLLRSMGLRKLTPRLQAFMEAVGVLEKGGVRAKRGLEKIVKMAASISKASTVLRDKSMWVSLVKWLASPLPQETPVDMKVVQEVLEVAKKSDRELEEKAKELAFTARRVGFIKLVDARGKWSGRGASALASKLYRILRQPIALLVRRDDGVELLIVRSRGSSAYRIAVGMLERGLAENIGGHSSLAVVRLRPSIDMKTLEDALRRLSFEAERARRRRQGVRSSPR